MNNSDVLFEQHLQETWVGLTLKKLRLIPRKTFSYLSDISTAESTKCPGRILIGPILQSI